MTLREQSKLFHKEHPEVWVMFERFTFELINSGRQFGGARAVWERIRWETAVNPNYNVDDFKLNNNYHPYYSRAFMKMYPKHDGFFRTRVLRAE